jgi:hypothetical protein
MPCAAPVTIALRPANLAILFSFTIARSERYRATWGSWAAYPVHPTRSVQH